MICDVFLRLSARGAVLPESNEQANLPGPMHGKPWKVCGKFTSYEGARILKDGIMLESDEVDLKIRLRADGSYILKMRDKAPSEIAAAPERKKSKKKKFRKGRRRDAS